jgi:hypothetical protein
MYKALFKEPQKIPKLDIEPYSEEDNSCTLHFPAAPEENTEPRPVHSHLRSPAHTTLTARPSLQWLGGSLTLAARLLPYLDIAPDTSGHNEVVNSVAFSPDGTSLGRRNGTPVGRGDRPNDWTSS